MANDLSRISTRHISSRLSIPNLDVSKVFAAEIRHEKELDWSRARVRPSFSGTSPTFRVQKKTFGNGKRKEVGRGKKKKKKNMER